MPSIQIINDTANASTSSLASSLLIYQQNNTHPLQRTRTVRRLSRWVSRRIRQEEISDQDRRIQKIEDERDLHESYAAFCQAFTSGQDNMDLSPEGNKEKEKEMASPPPKILTPSLYAEMRLTEKKKRRRLWTPIQSWILQIRHRETD